MFGEEKNMFPLNNPGIIETKINDMTDQNTSKYKGV